MVAINRAVLVMSTTGSIAAILLLILNPVIKNRLPKSSQYYLWILVLFAYLIPISSFVTIPVRTPMSSYHEIINGLQTQPLTMQWQAIETSSCFMSNGVINIALSLVMTIGVIFFVLEIIGYILFACKLRRTRKARLPEDTAMFCRLWKSKAQTPNLYRNSHVNTPILIGVFRPTIYLPDIEYTDEQLYNILMHEITHFCHHDIYIKWLTTLVVCINWINPIVYFVRNKIELACEIACDAKIILNLDVEGKRSYGNTLIAMAATAASSKIKMSKAMSEEKKALKARLEAIMRSNKTTARRKVSGYGIFIVMLSLIVFMGATHATAVGNFYPTVVWNYTPQLSSKLPAFPINFDLSLSSMTVDAICTKGEIKDGMDTLYWLPRAENGSHTIALSTEIIFTVYQNHNAVYNGKIAITGKKSDGINAATYSATLVEGAGLVIEQAEEAGAVVKNERR